MSAVAPEPLFEIVLTGWANGEVTGDHMSFHGRHTIEDVRAVLTAYLMALPPPAPPNVRLVPPVTNHFPQGVGA